MNEMKLRSCLRSDIAESLEPHWCLTSSYLQNELFINKWTTWEPNNFTYFFIIKNEEEYINFPTENEIYNKMINIDSYNAASPDNRHILNTSNLLL